VRAELSTSWNIRLGHLEVISPEWDARQLLVNRLPFVVERWRLENDAAGPTDASECEHPQKEAIQYHRHVFPILDDLKQAQRIYQC
jgi:hypothetical protein